MKLEVGAVHTFANANIKCLLNDFRLNSTMNFKDNLKEQNTGGDMQLSGLMKKVSWQAGIRAEITTIKGKYGATTSKLMDKNYTNFFPKV